MPAYADSVNGSVSATGSVNDPFKTLQAAVNVAASSNGDGQVIASAPEFMPFREEVINDSTVDVTISGLNDELWYHYGSNSYTVPEPIGRCAKPECFGLQFGTWRTPIQVMDPTILDANGFWAVYREIDVGPGICFDESVVGRTFEVPTRQTCIKQVGNSKLTVNHAVTRGAVWSGQQLGESGPGASSPNSILECNDCISEYNGVLGGFVTRATYDRMIVNNSRASMNFNDGANHHGNQIDRFMELNNFEASYNCDEGISGHDQTQIIVNNAHAHHNGSGGMTQVNDATHTVVDSLFELNNTKEFNPRYGGFASHDNTTGSFINSTVQNNDGPGYFCENPSNTYSGVTSIGNAAPDQFC